MCLCVTDQRWIYHCCSAQCTIDSGASSTATLWWWCLRERAAPTEQLAPVDAARANPMTRESKWLQQVIGLQRASWVHSWYSELYELYACQCSVSVRKPVFFSKSDSRDITDVWSECWDTRWATKYKDRDNEKKDTDNDNEMKRPFRKHPKVKIMMLHDCTWCYQVCQMRTSRDLSQFRFHPILPRQVVSCKTIIDMEPDSIHIARLSMFSQIHLTLLSWNLILFYTAKICQMGK